MRTREGRLGWAAPRKYPDELRERAVQLYRESSPRPSFKQLGEQLNIYTEALRGWVRQAEADAGKRSDRPPTEMLAENRRLQAGPAHGYDLLTRLPSVFPRATDPPDPGTFYRLLRSIEADGAITSSWQAPQAGPARKVYALTDTGREQLDWWGLQIERDLEALHRFRTAYRTATAPTGSRTPPRTANPRPARAAGVRCPVTTDAAWPDDRRPFR
jgi:DNA-binding PadR family transcriptional regulator